MADAKKPPQPGDDFDPEIAARAKQMAASKKEADEATAKEDADKPASKAKSAPDAKAALAAQAAASPQPPVTEIQAATGVARNPLIRNQYPNPPARATPKRESPLYKG